ncbi:MAG: hypothetical protein A2X52_16170 [Candidatus Rokubacteria bacterium GWC2_70_16]|nr:MAG: hypothetical protein A2X52_16170 [Candidatus Rokubacteria bacterium GWC2_70_16]OGL15566.1 MAG: hypothetical protein A3K12_01495 [Candidatus Rokubacteria bacterium RIFCSPLOWO2_12_FULL_71_19]
MNTVGLLAAGSVLALLWTAPGLAQQAREGAPSPEPKFEILAPGPAVRGATRPREAEFYREDVRVRHEPAFIEPLTATPASGPFKKLGLSAWTAPAGRGDGIVQHETSGWFGLGLSLVWE